MTHRHTQTHANTHTHTHTHTHITGLGIARFWIYFMSCTCARLADTLIAIHCLGFKVEGLDWRTH
jgi:valyl-tRNA synthetase